MKVFLVGYMFSGKTTAGRKLARKLNYKFFDTDDYFEKKFRITITDFFRKYNENIFRKLEKKVLEELMNNDKAVISTGGGTPCYFDNMDLIKRNGRSFYLKMSVKSLAVRAMNSKRKRPALQNIPVVELEEYIASHLKKREVYYLKADHMVKGENFNPQSILDKLNK